MSATVFYAGGDEFAQLQNIFKVNGVPTDPTTVTLTVTDPTGATSTPAVTHVTTGTYQANVACTIDGIWVYKWDGTGTASDVQEGTWTVGPSALGQYYCTAAELKSRLNITTTNDDFEAGVAVAAASRAIDGYCERFFYRTTVTRTYIPHDLYLTKVDDLVSVTALATDPAGTTPQGGTFPVTWAPGDFQLLPYNPGKPGEPWPYTQIRAVGHFTFPWVTPLALMRMDRVQVTGVFGWPAVPEVIHTMALTIAAELFRAKDVPGGSNIAGEFAVAVIEASPLVRQALEVYRRTPVLIA